MWLTASLSRISRHLGKLLQAVEYLLAHDVPILTANYLLRPREVWVRRGELATVDHEDPLAAWRASRGLSGVHRAVAAEAVKRMEAKERPRRAGRHIGRATRRTYPKREGTRDRAMRNSAGHSRELSSRFYAISPGSIPHSRH